MSARGAWPRALAVPLDVAVREEGAGGGWLLWRVRDAGGVDHGFARGEEPEGCLAAFLALEGAPLAAFAGFARGWGVLGICAAHDLPGVHGACAPRQGGDAHDLFPRTSLTEGWTVPLRIYREPVASWRALAGTLAASLRLARTLRTGECGEQADMVRLFGDAAAPAAAQARAVGEQRRQLAALVNGWLAEAGLRPALAWPFGAEEPTLVLEAPRGAGGGEDAFAWPARSLYPALLTALVGELAPR